MVARTVDRLAYRLTPNQQSALVSAIMSLGPITFSLPSRDSIKQAIHEGLGGNGWAYSDYGGDELNDCHDKLGGAADAILLLLVGGDQKETQTTKPTSSRTEASASETAEWNPGQLASFRSGERVMEKNYCCSASSPCSLQKKSPHSICDTCARAMGRVATIVVPSGYRGAEEFANDCGFQLIADSSPYGSLIGQLLDAWDALMGDQRGMIKKEAPEFSHWLLMLRSAADNPNPPVAETDADAPGDAGGGV